MIATTLCAKQQTPIQKLVLGTVQLGMPYGINNMSGQPSSQEAQQILQYAYDHGIRTLDTADAYGTAIQEIGTFHASSQCQFRVITKFHADATTDITQKLRETLDALHIPAVYCYQFHCFHDICAFPHVHNALRELQHSGYIHRVGVSVYTNDEILSAARMPMIDVIQFPFNLLDNMQLRGDVMRIAKSEGKELHARSIFLQGLLFKPIETFPKSLAPLIPYVQHLHRLRESSRFATKPTALQSLALHYVMYNPLIDAVLFGVETLSQLVDILHFLQEPPDIGLLQEVDNIIVQEASLLNPSSWA
ncbi:MAG: aldo/keto reductase [Bacteroidota bacterium]|nr:aldo/keto reductase [Candidatus Kapabacteria bacterium]MDW8220124.1 aldo/keto reductase [Bacteroidota bacterium]